MKILSLIVLIALLAACNEAAPTATSTPAATATMTASPVPTATRYTLPTLIPTDTPVPVTAAPTAVLIEPLTGVQIAPPLAITLPDGWEFSYDTMLFDDFGELNAIPFAIYRGEVSGGMGAIVLLWNFRSITPGNPNAEFFNEPNLWLDGLRLLRALIVEQSCNIGTDLQRDTFRVGDLRATGTFWSAVDCPDELPDIRGWFAGVNVEGVNFIFYVYGDPITVMDGNAPQEFQAILDSVDFQVDEFIADAQATATAAAAEATAEP